MALASLEIGRRAYRRLQHNPSGEQPAIAPAKRA
jgi:hypothetical protein